MGSSRIFGRLLPAAALLLLWLDPPAFADGLGRFEQLIKPQLPPGSLTYKSAKALGDGGFVLDGVVITPPPDKTAGTKAEPIDIKRISVEDLDFPALEKKQPPNFARVRIEGIAITGKPAEGVDLKELAGLDKLTADFQLDYRFEPDRKTLTLNRVELDLNGLGRLEVTMILDGVSPETAGKPDEAMNDASLRTASIVYEDHSLLAKAVPAAAKTQGADPAALVTTATTTLGALRVAAGPATQAVIDAVSSYVEDYKQPKGPLRVTLDPPGKISAAALSGASSPEDVIKALGIAVSYAGTVAKPAIASAPPAAAPASAPAKAECSQGTRFFVLHEESWQAATVRKTGKSGDCIAKIDGGDDEVNFAPEKALAWSIDGPGKPVGKCQAGAKVLVESDGAWHPGKIADKPFAEGQCPIKFDSDDMDDDTVALKRVHRLD
jgi:hypothetical protein